MSATQVLRDEHRGVERMLRIVELADQRLQAGQDVPPELYRSAVDFFRGFADACHHAKEEDKLFPALEQRGMQRDGGPIGRMLAEHEQGRAYVRAMDQASTLYAQGDRSAVPALVQAGQGYVQLLREHILKEDTRLFPMADQLLTEVEQAELAEEFETIERERTGPGEHERYHRVLDALDQVVAAW